MNRKDLQKAQEIFQNKGYEAAVSYLVGLHYLKENAVKMVHQIIDGLYDAAYGTSWK